MKDYREELLSTIMISVSLTGSFDPQQMASINSIIVSSLYSYEISERTTALSTVDRSSEQIIRLYLGSIATEQYSANTIKLYDRVLNRFYLDIGKNILEANVFDLRLWLANLGRTLTARTCENYRSYVCAFYNWLDVEGIIEKNPMLKMKPIRYYEEQEEPFSDTEVDRIRKACTTLREEVEVLLLLSTGARASEIAGLNISDVNLETGEVRIRHGKGDKFRIIHMSSICADYLRKYLSGRKDDSQSLIVNKYGNRMNKDTIGNDMRKLERLSGVSNVHAHRFRKTFAFNLKRRGCDITIIQKLLGHSSIDVTAKIYVKISDDMVKHEYMMKA